MTDQLTDRPGHRYTSNNRDSFCISSSSWFINNLLLKSHNSCQSSHGSFCYDFPDATFLRNVKINYGREKCGLLLVSAYQQKNNKIAERENSWIFLSVRCRCHPIKYDHIGPKNFIEVNFFSREFFLGAQNVSLKSCALFAI